LDKQELAKNCGEQDKMKEFKFDYDAENDDLFIYLENAESGGAVEFGNIIIDFDDRGNLVALEILEASALFSKLISTAFQISQIESLEVEIVNFRNMEALRLKILAHKQIYTHTLLIPRIKQESPALKY
jgi:uncharacterized protein YuzE